MKDGGSIATRLVFALTLSACVFWLISVGIGAVVLNKELNEAFDDTMRQSALRILPLAVHEIDEVMEGEEGNDDANFIHSLTAEGANLDYYVLTPDNRILIFSTDQPPSTTKDQVPLGFSDAGNGRQYALKDPDTGFGIVVSERQGLRDHILYESVTSMFLPLALLLPLLAALVYFVTRAAMSPIWKLGTAISRRHGRNLAPLALGPQPKELQPILSEVDNLLTRLTAAMNAERNFAAESAHELRTPIAGALAQIQVSQSQIDGPNTARHLQQAEQALLHLSRLSENLLQMSRLEAGFSQSLKKINLNEIINVVLREPAFAVGEDRIEFSQNQTKSTYAYITADAFAIIFRNLIQNALNYSPIGTSITVTLTATGLSVHNACEPIAPDLLASLTDRYVRGASKHKGTGLGLAIVKAIIDDCGGEFTLFSPTKGQQSGLDAVVRFPAEPHVPTTSQG